jgi:hypothetical protein
MILDNSYAHPTEDVPGWFLTIMYFIIKLFRRL